MFVFLIFPVRPVQQYMLLTAVCSSMFLRIAVCSVFNHRFHLALLHRLVSPARVCARKQHDQRDKMSKLLPFQFGHYICRPLMLCSCGQCCPGQNNQ